MAPSLLTFLGVLTRRQARRTTRWETPPVSHPPWIFSTEPFVPRVFPLAPLAVRRAPCFLISVQPARLAVVRLMSVPPVRATSRFSTEARSPLPELQPSA